MKRLAWLAAAGLLVGCDLFGGGLAIQQPGDEVIDPDNPIDPTDPVDEDDLDDVVEAAEIDVARVTLHRLNRAEYNNTVRDLLGDTTQPANDFPDDDFGYGFNNIADVLSLSPLHLEMYVSSAENLVDAALAGGAIDPSIQRFEAEDVGSEVGGASGDQWNLWSNGAIETVVNIPVDGEYTLRVSMRQQQAGPDDALSSVTVNGLPAQTFTVTPTTLTVFEVTTTIRAGAQAVGVTFENDYYDAAIPADRNLLVDWFEVEGPIGATGEPSPQRAEILTCETDDAACTTQVIQGFGTRAFRRPLTDEEVTELAAFVDVAKAEGLAWEDGIRLALQAILVSPHFIFRVELDDDLESSEPHALSQYEMASRLSYFLWSSMPDAELMQLAADGRLQEEATLRAEVQRMLDDPKAMSLVDNFATQWLFIDVINNFEPDYQLFPDFSRELGDAMREETRLFVTALLSDNAPISELLLADYTYVNGLLASHYELGGATGQDFQRVTLTGEGRRGLLSHAGLLSSLSFPTRTSPVKRGAWVLGNLLCSEPPAPPPGVENLPMNPGAGATLREQMEAHSNDPACSACHMQMDPIGFGLENFNAIGAWRDTDNGQAVDSAGVLPDGTEFSGAYELAEILAANPKYSHCLTEKMLTYGLGRGVEYYDEAQMNLLLAELGETFGFRDLITEIVLSPAFRMRRGGELPPTN